MRLPQGILHLIRRHRAVLRAKRHRHAPFPAVLRRPLALRVQDLRALRRLEPRELRHLVLRETHPVGLEQTQHLVQIRLGVLRLLLR